jgi:hypothetical protein
MSGLDLDSISTIAICAYDIGGNSYDLYMFPSSRSCNFKFGLRAQQRAQESGLMKKLLRLLLRGKRQDLAFSILNSARSSVPRKVWCLMKKFITSATTRETTRSSMFNFELRAQQRARKNVASYD